jgi:hypothetical protein
MNSRFQVKTILITLALLALFLFANTQVAQAQWNPSPSPSPNSNIYYNAGNVGIGTSTPDEQFNLTGNLHFTSTGSAIYAKPSSAATTNLDLFSLASGTSAYGGNGAGIRIQSNSNAEGFVMFSTSKMNVGSAERMRIDNSGNVGIGTTDPNGLLHLNGIDNQLVISKSGTRGMEIGTDGTTSTILAYDRGSTAYKTLNYNGLTHIFSVSGVEKVRIDSSGNVGIGRSPDPAYKLDVNGTISGNNVIAKYQDVAEWVPSSEHLASGTVVVLDSTKSNQVTSSSVSYDTRVAGVVSEQPGIALGEKSESKVLVATTGRVKVKVDASKGAIHIGDLLVTSDIPGVAMKSEPINLGGVQLHRPGTLIGKALEPLEKGKGEILVLLSLQ